MRTFLLTLKGIDTPARRAAMEGVAVELGWVIDLGIHPEPPKARHLRFRVEAIDRDVLMQAIDQVALPEGVAVAEAREVRPSTFGWSSER